MRRLAISVAVLGAALLRTAASQTPQPPAKSTSAKSAQGKSNQIKSAKALSSSNGSAAHKTYPPSAQIAAASRSGRTSRNRSRYSRAHVPPPPSYQLHPDPERYQQIQQALVDRGYFKGDANGTWGDDSVDALKRFQIDQKLPDDGHISALTLTALGLGPKHDGSTAGSATSPMTSVPVPPSATSPTPVSSSVPQPPQGPPK